MSIRFTALLLCASFMWAQDKAVSSEEAPPEVDAALRARIQHFYQAHVDGKFRLADQVVAEDSKDFFFAAAKQKFGGYQIVRINYKENFTKAEAVVLCQSEMLVRDQRLKVNMSVPSLWKLVDGQWFWYVIPTEEVQTPFGNMRPGATPATPNAGMTVPPDPMVLARQILQAVKADKSELMLSSYEKSSGEITITNGLQGPVTLRANIDGAFAGLTYTLDKTTVEAGGTAVLKIECEPKDQVAKPTLTARILVEPTNQTIPVKLMFAIPPEIEKQIPKDARTRP